MERESLLIAGYCLVLFAFFLLLYWYSKLNARFKKFINEEHLPIAGYKDNYYRVLNDCSSYKAELQGKIDKLKASLSALRMEETSLTSENMQLKAELNQATKLSHEYRTKYEYAKREAESVAVLRTQRNEVMDRNNKLREIADEKMREVIQLRKQLAIAKGLATRYKNELKK